jgi:hypothetical protein
MKRREDAVYCLTKLTSKSSIRKTKAPGSSPGATTKITKF